ncbi:MAG: hypothetical protein RM022_030365 [Nostoc sp. EfeVER01]|nr:MULTISPECIES: hypothetical protein [unclassified Nostoc]MDZ7945437.1 hypothetical protein [Nostoc sp. EfeVER01]MDZ7994008.1 hypothetical protein [Nostoc sp. EspVER01]
MELQTEIDKAIDYQKLQAEFQAQNELLVVDGDKRYHRVTVSSMLRIN